MRVNYVSLAGLEVLIMMYMCVRTLLLAVSLVCVLTVCICMNINFFAFSLPYYLPPCCTYCHIITALEPLCALLKLVIEFTVKPLHFGNNINSAVLLCTVILWDCR